MSKQSYIDAPDSDTSAGNALADYHDNTLWAFLAAADDLGRLGYTPGQLARLVERHLTPAVAPFPRGTQDPFAGEAA